LNKLIEFSGSSRLAQLDASIKEVAKSRPSAIDLELLTDLKLQLLQERSEVFKECFSRIRANRKDPYLKELVLNIITTANAPELEEVLRISDLIADLDVDDHILLIQMTQGALQKNLERSSSGRKLLVPLVRRLETISRGKEETFQADMARMLLVRLGSESGEQLVKSAIALAGDKTASRDALCGAIRDSIVYFECAPGSISQRNLAIIGDNVRRGNDEYIVMAYLEGLKRLSRNLKLQKLEAPAATISSYVRQTADGSNSIWDATLRKLEFVPPR
jgi:hypothetical protein